MSLWTGRARAGARSLISEVGLVPGGVVHVLQDPPDRPLQLLPRPLLLLQRLAHPLVVLLCKKMLVHEYIQKSRSESRPGTTRQALLRFRLKSSLGFRECNLHNRRNLMADGVIFFFFTLGSILKSRRRARQPRQEADDTERRGLDLQNQVSQ